MRKFDLFTLAGNRVIAILSAGNLATTQSVISELREVLGSGKPEDLNAARSMRSPSFVGKGDSGPVVASHTFSVASALELTRRFPSGLKPTPKTQLCSVETLNPFAAARL